LTRWDFYDRGLLGAAVVSFRDVAGDNSRRHILHVSLHNSARRELLLPLAPPAQVHVPSRESRDRKTLCGMREALVGTRTKLVNTVRGWLPIVLDGFSKKT
jgi:hypothetical protein